MVIVTETIVEAHGTSLAGLGNSHYVNQERLLQADTAADLGTVPIRDRRDDMGFGGKSSFLDVKGLILTRLCKVLCSSHLGLKQSLMP